MSQTVAEQPIATIDAAAPDDAGIDQFQTDRILTIVGGHFVHDTYSAFIAVLLPRLIEKLSLSLFQAGSLSSFTQAAALLNVFIGLLADKVSLHYFVILAPAVTATLITSLGSISEYALLAVILLVSGVSVSAFHVPAPVMISRISGNRVGKGMSLYMAGGELGRTVGPLLVAWAISTWTLEGIWRLAALGWITSAILYWRFRNITAQAAPKNRKSIRTVFPALRRLFIPLSAMMFFRSFLIAAMSVFVPTLMESLGYTPEESALALAIWFFAGIGGALMGGTVSDRLGRKPLLILAVGGGGLMMVGFLGALNIGGIVLIPVLLVSGFISLSGTSVVHALVLEQNPEYRATASGIFMLLAFLSRSIATLLIGGMGDWIGLETAFLVTAVLSLCAIPLIVILPDLKQKTEG